MTEKQTWLMAAAESGESPTGEAQIGNAQQTRDRSAADVATATRERRELDARTGDGLDVRMLWDPVTDRVVVTVADLRTASDLEVRVGDGESARDVFDHPFAYAAHHGIEPRPAIDGT